MARDDSAVADLQAVGSFRSNGRGVCGVVLDEAETQRGPRGGILRDTAGLDVSEHAKDIVQCNVVEVAVEILEADVSRSAVGTQRKDGPKRFRRGRGGR